MTREEAIARIKDHMIIHEIKEPRAIYISEALDMAIEALSQEPCEDCISRQAAIDRINKQREHLQPDIYPQDKIGDAAYRICAEFIERLPSAQPEQRWIPCSERLPEEMGTYMTTIDYGEHGLVTGQRYYYGRGLKWNDECVIAWMPLPEPYKAESEVAE